MAGKQPKPPTKAVVPKWTRAWENVARSAESGSVEEILRKVLAAEAHIQVLTGGMGDDAHRRMSHMFQAVQMLKDSAGDGTADKLAALFGKEDE